MISARELDDCMNRSWRARSEVAVDGWLVRRSSGVTQRANSVLPVSAPADLAAAITRVEELYQDEGLPPCFQISPAARPAELDQVLADRGYELRGDTEVRVAAVEDVLRRLPPARGPVDVHDAPGPDWMGLWWAVDGRGGADARAVARDILGGGPALYALRRDAAGPAAVGRVSLVGRWAGVYCMAVRADARRRGHATEVLRALLVGAADRGARHTWLQVVADNAAARALYERVGFADFSRYHYRVHPAPRTSRG
ncbi:GNAT family N-acetyltransferase [Saccharopolyspora cebuensis]|uniref:GNAT family N-acetyltransferase n=1 Tax=Saccharopolyspora cebuensis TaxID=418759 RepID=A0ABV4CB16_9PSEU